MGLFKRKTEPIVNNYSTIDMEALEKMTAAFQRMADSNMQLDRTLREGIKVVNKNLSEISKNVRKP